MSHGRHPGVEGDTNDRTAVLDESGILGFDTQVATGARPARSPPPRSRIAPDLGSLESAETAEFVGPAFGSDKIPGQPVVGVEVFEAVR